VIDVIVAEDDQIEVDFVVRDAAAVSRTMKWCLLIRFGSRWSPKRAARKDTVPENGLRIPIEIKLRQHFDRVSLRCQSRRGEVVFSDERELSKNAATAWRSMLIPET
jgi:hypothetical protein